MIPLNGVLKHKNFAKDFTQMFTEDIMEELNNVTHPLNNETVTLNMETPEAASTPTVMDAMCFAAFKNRTPVFIDQNIHCNTTWDGLSCWPATNAGDLASVSCFSELNGVLYDTLENASRPCYENGTWAERSDYSSCIPLPTEERVLKGLWDVKEAATIYYIGYALSLIALIAALSIFLHFKYWTEKWKQFNVFPIENRVRNLVTSSINLRCLRNNIHTNLLATYLLLDLTWIITATLQSIQSVTASKAACVLVIFLTYLMGTNFFWMFVEGMYLYILAVKTFSIEVVRMHVYAFIGWGLPAVIVVSWASVKAYFAPLSKDTLNECAWQIKDNYDYIFICPVIIVLVVNVFFLGEIMWVLITKLRVATSAESKQYRKAAKALLVLIPLLGMTYVLVIVTPSHPTARIVFSYLQAVLLSTQGFTVAVLYCFLNGEVQKSVRHLWKRLTTRRTIHGSQRYSLSYRSSHYGDSNLKLYRSRGIHNRGSCASFTTTTTSMSNNWHSCHRLGSE